MEFESKNPKVIFFGLSLLTDELPDFKEDSNYEKQRIEGLEVMVAFLEYGSRA